MVKRPYKWQGETPLSLYPSPAPHLYQETDGMGRGREDPWGEEGGARRQMEGGCGCAVCGKGGEGREREGEGGKTRNSIKQRKRVALRGRRVIG